MKFVGVFVILPYQSNWTSADLSEANMLHSSKNICVFCPEVPDEVRVMTYSSRGLDCIVCVL